MPHIFFKSLTKQLMRKIARDLRTYLITPSMSELATHVPVQLNLQWVMSELCSEYFS